MECEDWQSRRSLVSSLKILLTLESAGLVLTLTAGASIIAQLGEFSQCILFTYKGDRPLLWSTLIGRGLSRLVSHWPQWGNFAFQSP